MANCLIAECARSSVARGWCQGHWRRWKKYGDPTFSPGRRRIPAEDRFWPKVRKGGPNECWEWTASRDNLGYGMFRLIPGENMRKTHRVAWELTNGPIPPGLSVCHQCDNPPCVNPFHLFLGTHQVNMQDRNDKGRTTKGRILHHGEGSGRSAKLTLSQVLEIRERYAAGGVSQSQLGAIYGVSQTQVGRITRGVRWFHDLDALSA